MKTSVRFLSLLLAVLMLAGAALTASADAEKDVNSEALQLLVDLGIFGGYEDGSLQPDKLVERDEMAKIIFVLNTTMDDAGEAQEVFKDVPVNNWAAGYITWCANKDIIGGYGNGNFGPDDHVTYDQALKMVCGALGYTDWSFDVWPINVRTKALRDLELGKDITGVKGEDKITRGQVAQIVYNALFVDMEETKLGEVPFFGTVVTAKVHKTLAVDVWNFGEAFASIDGAGNVGAVSDATKYDVSLKDKDNTAYTHDFTLEELGLEEYEKNITDLYLANIRIFYDAKKVDEADVNNITADDIIATSLTITGDKNVPIVYNDEEKQLYVGDNVADEQIYQLTVSANGTATQTLINQDAPSANIPEDKSLYKSIAFDLDQDNLYDVIYWSYLKAYEVVTVTDYRLTLKDAGDNSPLVIKSEDLISSATLEDEDVIVAYYVYNDFVVDAVVEPVEARAIRYNGKKLVLEEAGEFIVNEEVFVDQAYSTISDTVMTLNENDQTSLYSYYIYNGKVFKSGAPAGETDLKFAILSYINEPGDAVLDPVTMETSAPYTAVVTIDGKEKTVNVKPTDVIDGLDITNPTDKVQIMDLYGKKYTDGQSLSAVCDGAYKYVNNYHYLVTYRIDENGNYSFVTSANTAEVGDYKKLAADGLKLELDKASNLYKLMDGDTMIEDKIVLGDTIVLYESYEEDATGAYKHLREHTIDTLPAKIKSLEVSSTLFCLYDADTDIYEIVIAVIGEDAIEVAKEATADYKTDSRVLYVATATSFQTLTDDGKDTYYTYSLRPINEKSSTVAMRTDRTVNEGATPVTDGCIYYWDETADNYIRLNKSYIAEVNNNADPDDDVTSINVYTVNDFVNNCIITTEGPVFKIAGEAIIYAYNWESASYVTYTADEITSILEAVQRYNEETESTQTVKALIGTYEDENGDPVVSTVIIERYRYNDYDEFIWNKKSGKFYVIDNFAE